MTGDRTPTPAEHFAGLADSECGEHRTVGVRAWCYRDGEWCSPYAPCRGCELPALRQRAEQAKRERDTAREALDAAAIVIASLRDQRNEQRQRADKAERRVEHFEEHAAQVDADLGIETHRAETAERKLQQALDQIATERRGRLAAEAAARRGREIHRRHDCGRHVNPRTPVPCVNAGLCEGCGAKHPCQTYTALTIKQPKETPR